ncbi:MAG: hypothetical protein OXG37_00235 [Actinomycetia bacterium]|nr:hypothetical protein [Actinomycetes bacterium]
MEEADQSRGGNGRPGQEISGGQIDKALVSIREGVPQAAACEEHGFPESVLIDRSDLELAERVEEANRISVGSLERIARERARGSWRLEELRLGGTTKRRKKPKIGLSLRLQERVGPDWGKGKMSGAPAQQTSMKLAPADMQTMLEALDESWPGGIFAIIELEGIAEKFGINMPAGDGHPGNSG